MAFLKEKGQRDKLESYKIQPLQPWGDTIAVESLFVGEFLALSQGPLSNFFRLFRSSEPSTSLLIHLCTRCDPIHRHKEQFFGFYLPENMVDICENGGKNLFL